MNKILILFVFIALLFFFGCSDDNPAGPDNGGPNTSVPAAKFSDIQAKVFTTNCALSGCHGTTNTQANLVLAAGQAYSNLVNVQGSITTNLKRVEPGNSANSIIIKRLRGEITPRMPLDKDPLPAAVIDSIAKWIDNGALNN